MRLYGILIVLLVSLVNVKEAVSEQVYFGIDGQATEKVGIVIGADYQSFVNPLSNEVNVEVEKHTSLMQAYVDAFVDSPLSEFELLDRIVWGAHFFYSVKYRFSEPKERLKLIILPIICPKNQCIIDRYLDENREDAAVLYVVRAAARESWGKGRIEKVDIANVLKHRFVHQSHPTKDGRIGSSITVAFPYEPVRGKVVSLTSKSNDVGTYSIVWNFIRKLKSSGTGTELKILADTLTVNGENSGFMLTTSKKRLEPKYIDANHFIQRVKNWNVVYPVGIIRGIRRDTLAYRINDESAPLQMVSLASGSEVGFSDLPFSSDEMSLLFSSGAMSKIGD